ncbi:MAG: YdcF family protein [Nitrospina sp.]|jgi:uncharacterized SAM-binding protein YcdF (DUF218 family)|nr:YdcF family protein [Nitrospina sp.]
MDTAIWVFSKVAWLLFDPDNGLLILLVLGAVLLYTGREKLGRRLVAIASVALLVLSIFPWSGLLLLPLENRFPIPEPLPESIDGIIVLSGAERARIAHARDQAVLRDSAERLTTFVGLSRRFPKAKLIFAGGAGGLGMQEYKDADTARILFEQLGLSANRVQFESSSRNTVENARNSFKLAKPQMGENWVLITSASHMPRAVGVFRSIGWPVIPYPVDFSTTGKIELGIIFDGLENINSISWALHEWVGIVAYRLMGRTSELFPGPL